MTLSPVYTKPNRAESTLRGRCVIRVAQGVAANAQACAIGRSSKTVREFLEKNYTEELDRAQTIKLTVKSLLEVVQTGAKNIEISVMESYGKITVSGLIPWWPSVLPRLLCKADGRR